MFPTMTTTIECQISEGCSDLEHSIATGIGFLDHMLDQLHSHAQLRVHLQAVKMEKDATDSYVSAIGTAVGTALWTLLQSRLPKEELCSSTFACPLDEALVVCVLKKKPIAEGVATETGVLESYTLAPYGIYPRSTGRVLIGTLPTASLESFWRHLARALPNVSIELCKIRGHNAHHIVESSFKAFARALRNWIDGIDAAAPADGGTSALNTMYGRGSDNTAQSLALCRTASIARNTKETSIRTEMHLDGGAKGISIQTGVQTLDAFLSEFALYARISLHVTCRGDLWIDEHHTAEDVAISIGQALHEALGTKAGLNRMWYASVPSTSTNDDFRVAVTMDLSNRPCFVHNLSILEEMEMMGDLSCEMFVHVLDSIVTNARMTVHVVEEGRMIGLDNADNKDPYRHPILMATAGALGDALHMCALVDSRRAGKTASSKGTLSV